MLAVKLERKDLRNDEYVAGCVTYLVLPGVTVMQFMITAWIFQYLQTVITGGC